jgi:serine/threonine-protein kinase
VAKAPPPRAAPQQQQVAKKVAPARVETKAPPRAEPKPAATTSCNPPYYFDGDKKIFKPSCL